MLQRTRNLYDPKDLKPFKLSRSRLERFLVCPRCFYLDRRLGIDQPPTPAFTLNSAVDHLLKKEFDRYRQLKKPHPIMIENHVDAIPFSHPDLDIWRENFKGVQFHHEPSNFLVTGAVDDLWQDPNGQLNVVDYKSTSKDGEVELTDSPWHKAYKRQMEIYQWLLRRNGFEVSPRGYFVYVNGRKDVADFGGQLVFETKLLGYDGSDHWVEDALIAASKCLKNDKLPPLSAECSYCNYRKSAQAVES